MDINNVNLEDYILPPEWFPHEATWLSWLHNKETWPRHILEKALPAYEEFIFHLAQDEKVRINCPLSAIDTIHTRLSNCGVAVENVELFAHQTNDSWCRDHGPDFLINSKQSSKIVLDWQYNCWGEKYPPFTCDNEIPLQVANALKLPSLSIPMVLEGGSFDVNGEGVLLTTASCLLNRNRNPSFSKEKIEHFLRGYLRQDEVIWLPEGIAGDDTDGHIDDIARFVSSNQIVMASTHKKDENFEILQRNKSIIEAGYNERFEVIDLPMPKKMLVDDVLVPASYCNFYIANNKVIVPTFNDPNDSEALAILRCCFPERDIVGVDSSNLIYGLGSFHCLSKHEPVV